MINLIKFIHLLYGNTRQHKASVKVIPSISNMQFINSPNKLVYKFS